MALALRLRPRWRLRATPDALLLDDDRGETLALAAVPAPVGRALDRLAGDGATQQQLTADLFAGGGGDAILDLHAALHRLRRAGALCDTATDGGVPLVTLVAQSPQLRLGGEPAADRRYVLSRLAYVHRTGEGLVARSPLGHARAILHGAPGARLLAAFAAPRTVADAGASADAVRLLAAAAVLVGDEQEAGSAEPWEFHDLLFHASTRHGRSGAPYGGTGHRRGHSPPPPAIKAPAGGPRIALHRPDLERLARSDPPFSAVLEARRSRRDYAPQALTATELGEFLYRALRVQHLLQTGPDELDLSLRPHPGGGAIHELETYVVVGACDGLGRGIYRYDPLEHALERLAGDGAPVAELLHAAWITADRRSQPQVYFAFTARYERLAWKYESIVYALILKNIGAVYATMYLVATAMGLAPAALGGGHVDRFALAAGLDPLAECPVGEFVLGTRGEA
jgi:SagB-type dehydrogenase family enzyme